MRSARSSPLPPGRVALALATALALGGCQKITPPRRPSSAIQHLVVIVQENHTFDSYFARYCTAPSGSNPSCSDGPGCCERGPDNDPSGAARVVLDDKQNGTYDPSHLSACETVEIDGGRMDHFVAGNAQCGNPQNFAYADGMTVQPYWTLAANGALADRWFQPTVGQSAANDIYFATARFAFADDTFEPVAVGAACSFTTQSIMLDPAQSIFSLLDAGGVSWTWYAGGYEAMLDAAIGGHCPDAPEACAAGLPISPCVFDPADVPSEYFPTWVDQWRVMRDVSSFAADIDRGLLPQVSFVKPIGYQSEHPGFHTTISDGIAFVQATVDKVLSSGYAGSTLVLIVYDEGGGFFDHVAPPAASKVDGQAYGTRVPAIAVGPLAKKGTISHVELEHSSIVRFIEWNFLGAVGQLNARDAAVANLGSLVDPALGVPAN